MTKDIFEGCGVISNSISRSAEVGVFLQLSPRDAVHSTLNIRKKVEVLKQQLLDVILHAAFSMNQNQSCNNVNSVLIILSNNFRPIKKSVS